MRRTIHQLCLSLLSLQADKKVNRLPSPLGTEPLVHYHSLGCEQYFIRHSMLLSHIQYFMVMIMVHCIPV